MRLVDGFFYEPKTGDLFNDEGGLQAFTFQKDIPDGYNPLHFASIETAQAVAKLVTAWTGIEPRIVDVHLAPAPNFNRPFPERMIQFNGANYNAGLIASQILRAGLARAKNQFLDQLPKE
jgi:hypothetical protein